MRATNEIQADINSVNDAIRGLISGGAIQGYSIAGRTVSKYSLADLQNLKKMYQDELRAAESRSGGRGQVRFDR